MRAMTRLSRAAALALAITGGLWAGHALTSTSAAPETHVVRAGPATLEVPDGWRTVSVTFGPAADRTLVPAPLRALVGEGPRPATLAGHAAWRYDAPRRREITVLPTSDGVLAVACRGECAESIAAVSLPGAEILVASEDLALQLKLPETLQSLDRARVDGRTALARPARIAGRRGWRAGWHASIVPRRTRCVLWQDLPALPDALETVSDAYADLERAAMAGSPSRFRAARAWVGAAEARLARAVPATALRRAPAPRQRALAGEHVAGDRRGRVASRAHRARIGGNPRSAPARAGGGVGTRCRAAAERVGWPSIPWDAGTPGPNEPVQTTCSDGDRARYLRTCRPGGTPPCTPSFCSPWRCSSSPAGQ